MHTPFRPQALYWHSGATNAAAAEFGVLAYILCGAAGGCFYQFLGPSQRGFKAWRKHVLPFFPRLVVGIVLGQCPVTQAWQCPVAAGLLVLLFGRGGTVNCIIGVPL